jgi:hypothetical protein
MTRKDFVLIAKVFRRADDAMSAEIKALADSPDYSSYSMRALSSSWQANRTVARDMADALASANPSFDRARFLLAAIDSEV